MVWYTLLLIRRLTARDMFNTPGYVLDLYYCLLVVCNMQKNQLMNEKHQKENNTIIQYKKVVDIGRRMMAI